MLLEGRELEWWAKEELGRSAGIYSSSSLTPTTWRKRKKLDWCWSIMCAFYRAWGVETGPLSFLLQWQAIEYLFGRSPPKSFYKEQNYIPESVNLGIQERTRDHIGGGKEHFWGPIVDFKKKKTINNLSKIYIFPFISHLHSWYLELNGRQRRWNSLRSKSYTTSWRLTRS